MKKTEWKVDYSRGDGIVVIIIEDHTGKKEAVFKANQKDYKSQKIIGKILKEKYEIDFSPSIEKPVEEEKKDFFDF